MSNSTQIARRYAKALFDLAQDENNLYPIYVSLREITQILKEKEEFNVFVHNPLLSIDERGLIISRIFENKIPKLLFKFLLFINLKNRLDILDKIGDAFDDLYLAKNNQIRAHLETAIDLDNLQKQDLQKKLAQKYNKEIVLESQIRKDLLGGFRFLAEGVLYDSSIKSQLEQFRQKVVV